MLNILAQTGAGEMVEGLKAIGAGLGYGLAAIGPGICLLYTSDAADE